MLFGRLLQYEKFLICKALYFIKEILFGFLFMLTMARNGSIIKKYNYNLTK